MLLSYREPEKVVGTKDFKLNVLERNFDYESLRRRASGSKTYCDE